MYRYQDIIERIREKPFKPFRIIASEGLKYDILHPDLVFVGRHDLMIGYPAPKHPNVYDRVTRVALVHVVALEDIPVVPASTNGPA